MRRLRRLAATLVVTTVVLVTLLLTAFGSSPRTATVGTPARPSPASVTAGPPRPQVVAAHGSLRLNLPVAARRLTAIGYHGAGDGSLALQPLGKRGNQGLLRRLAERLFGAGGSGLTWYQLEGAGGPPTSALDIGAPADTDVYSPVDGEIVAVSDFVLNGRRFGAQIDIRPSSAPSLVVSLTRLRPDPAVEVGDAVAATTSRLGRVVDLSAVERHALARYTHDAGNHVTLTVRTAATLTLH